MSQQPLYRIVYADGANYNTGLSWEAACRIVHGDCYAARVFAKPRLRPVRVERVSPAPRATGGER